MMKHGGLENAPLFYSFVMSCLNVDGHCSKCDMFL